MGDLAYRVYAKDIYDSDTLTSTDEKAHDHWAKPQGGFRFDWTPSKADLVTLQGDVYAGSEAQDGAPVQDVHGGNVLGRWDHAWRAGLRRRALGELGYDVICAPGPTEGLRLLDAHPEISVLLSDVVMPEMNGRLLAEEAVRRRPSLRVIFMTGYTRNAIVHNGVLDAGTHLLNKPFTISQLEAELSAAVRR